MSAGDGLARPADGAPARSMLTSLRPGAWLWRRGIELLGARGEGRRLSILIFHRVAPRPDPLFPDEMDAQRFDRLCAWLAACFNVLPLDLAVQKLGQGQLPARPLAITFDDGYADNHGVALPILERHGLCATFFVATSFLDGGRMFNDTVIESVRRAQQSTIALDTLGDTWLGSQPIGSDSDRAKCIGLVLRAVKYLQPERRDLEVQELWRRCGQPVLPTDLMMTAQQVRALHRAGMQIGAHTRTHPILAKLDEIGTRNEVLGGKTDLEGIINAPVQLFAYPNGRPGEDYSATSIVAVRQAGFTAAVSTSWGAAERGSDRYQLPRFTPWDLDSTRFGVRLLANLRRRQRDFVT